MRTLMYSTALPFMTLAETTMPNELRGNLITMIQDGRYMPPLITGHHPLELPQRANTLRP